MANVSIDLLLETLGKVPNQHREIETLSSQLTFLGKFVKQTEEKLYAHEKVINVVPRMRDVAYEAEDAILRHLFGASEKKSTLRAEIFGLFANLDHFKKEIDFISNDSIKMVEIGDFGKMPTKFINMLLMSLKQLKGWDIPYFVPEDSIDNDPNSFRLTGDSLAKTENLCKFLRILKRNRYAPVPRIRDVVVEAEVAIVGHLFRVSEHSRPDIFDVFGILEPLKKEIDSIRTELLEIYSSGEMVTVSIDVLLERLKQLMNHRDIPDLIPGGQIDNDLDSFRLILDCMIKIKKFRDDLDAHDKVKNLVSRIKDVAFEAEVIINWYLFEVSEQRGRRRKQIKLGNLDPVGREINSIRTSLEEIYGGLVPQDGNSCEGGSSRANFSVLDEELVVGFDDALEEIRDTLAGAHSHLQVLSIVGMAGLGVSKGGSVAWHSKLPYQG